MQLPAGGQSSSTGSPLCQVPASASEGMSSGDSSEVNHWIIAAFLFLRHSPQWPLDGGVA